MGAAAAPTAACPLRHDAGAPVQGESYQLRTAGLALHAPGQPPSPWPETQSAGVSSASPGWAIPATSDIRGQTGAEPAAHVQPLLLASLSSPPERANSAVLADIRPKASTGYACCRLPRDRLLIWPSARRTTKTHRRRRAGLAAEQVEMGKVGQPAGK
jgi:hypothetical protein